MRIAGIFLAGVLSSSAAVANPVSLEMDKPTMVQGVETVCTGVGEEARQDPAWNGYSLKVEVAGNGGVYLADEIVRVRKAGADLLSVQCAGPWVLFKLQPGSYQIVAEMDDATASSLAFVAGGSQGRVILRFPNMGTGPYPRNYSDEMAEALGIKNGRLDALALHPKPQDRLTPNLTAGLGKKGARLDLDWKLN
ncbi:MAG TPA: hypothetical protein VG798_02955 [Rhizomicrobium sp.]|nr:hypothetical protein [Rhizomicrobium sp.]